MTDHLHANDEWKCVEIGPDVCLSPFYHGDDEHLAGFFVSFDLPGDEGSRVPGAVNVDPHFAGERPIWTMTGSLDGGDLSLSPSVLMKSPGAPERERHGYVTNGKWVPA
jgi:hypothetical protein